MPSDVTRLALPAGLDLPSTVEVRGLGLVAESTVEQRMSTWDTPDGRLARHGIVLSQMDGSWALRLADGEVRASGGARQPQAELRALVTGWVRTARLQAVRAVLVSRTNYRLADADGVTTAQ